MKQIKDYPNYFVNENGQVFNKKRELKPFKNSNGYLQIDLRNGNKPKSFLVHRLIAMTFLNNDNLKLDVNHINGIKTDNNLQNLEWVTRSENLLHSFKLGLSKVNDKNRKRFTEMVNIRMKNRSIILNKENGIFYFNVKEIAELYNLNYNTLKAKLRGQLNNNTQFVRI
jgi:hypothetical protein